MLRMTGFLLAIGVGYTTPAVAQAFVGTWTATAHLDGGIESLETLTVKREGTGYSITGRAVDPQPGAPQAGPGVEIMIEGDKFAYKRTLNFQGNEIIISYVGNVSGDTFAGTADVGGLQVPYSGVRVQASR